MALRVSKGNMYSWVTHTWNPVKGKCPHDCSYCYMKRFGKQNPLRLVESELKTDLGKDNYIFVGSSCDLFAEEVNSDWIKRTLEYCKRFDNTYLFQSKNPRAFLEISEFYPEWLPERSIFCTTIESDKYYHPEMGNTPSPRNRATSMYLLSNKFKKYVTIEPIMDFDIDGLVELIKIFNPQQVNIGSDSCGNHLPEPSKDKILTLIDALKEFTVIDQKKNLNRLLK